MNGIRRIVLDILKPHEPKITDMALKLTSLSNIDGVNITVYEIDKETENVKVTIEGNNLDFDEIQEIIESLGGTIHSIDEVVAGKKIIEELEHHKIKNLVLGRRSLRTRNGCRIACVRVVESVG